MSNARLQQFYYTKHKMPVQIDCNFSVAASAASGIGISGLKGGGVQAVYMNSSAAFTGTSHTSTLVDSIASTSALVVGMRLSGSGIVAGTKIAAIPSSTSITLDTATTSSVTGSIVYSAVGSPSPAAGVIQVIFQDNYNRYFCGFSQQQAALSGSALTSVTAGTAYVITVLGTTTLAQWQAKGLPVGIAPAVGVSFVASYSGALGGTGAVQITAAAGSGIDHIEVIGDPNKMLQSSALQIAGVQSGSYMLLQCFAGGVKTQPADGSVLDLCFVFSNSSILVQGEQDDILR